MTRLLLLLSYAGLLGWLAPVVLTRARWVLRAPQLAIGIWQALSVSFVVSLALAGLEVASRPGNGGWATYVGIAIAASIVARVIYTGLRLLRHRRGRLRWQRTVLALTGRDSAELGATVVGQDTPAIYCMPGRRGRGRIVVTTGALRTLTQDQLAATLAHERAHLAARHHLAVAVTATLALALPGIPLLRHTHREVAVLTEMAADDAARRDHSGAALAGALVRLTAVTVTAALGAGGHTVVHRLDRILTPPPPLPLTARAIAAGVTTFAPAIPLALACAALTATVTAVLAYV